MMNIREFFYNHTGGIIILLLAGILLSACQQGGTPDRPPSNTPTEVRQETPQVTVNPTTPSTPTTRPTQTDEPTSAAIFEVFRETPNVSVGESEPLPTMSSAGPAALLEGHKVSTDLNGEALLQGELEGMACSIFIFSNGSLSKSPCPAAAATGGNTSCQTGSAAYRDCDALLIQTPSLEAFQVGSWSWITYLPEEQLTVVLTSEGRTVARPVLEADGWVLSNEAMEVPAGTWLYTAPDDMQIEVPGVPAREARPWDEVEALLNQYPEIRSWVERALVRAEQDDVRFPVLGIPEPTPTPVPGPDLHIELEVQGPPEPVQGYEGGDLILPVLVRVFNRGDQPADIFKVAMWEITPEGRRFLVPFVTETQEITFYRFTEEPLDSLWQVEFTGWLLFNSETMPEIVTLQAEADSCAGEEFVAPYCRVDEYDERNNLSEPVEAVVR